MSIGPQRHLILKVASKWKRIRQSAVVVHLAKEKAKDIANQIKDKQKSCQNLKINSGLGSQISPPFSFSPFFFLTQLLNQAIFNIQYSIFVILFSLWLSPYFYFVRKTPSAGSLPRAHLIWQQEMQCRHRRSRRFFCWVHVVVIPSFSYWFLFFFFFFSLSKRTDPPHLFVSNLSGSRSCSQRLPSPTLPLSLKSPTLLPLPQGHFPHASEKAW